MKNLSTLDWVAMILLAIGGLNWLLIALFSFNLVAVIFGAGLLAKVVYTLVGLSAGYVLFILRKLGRK
jgi:uncharacterized membrane protein YuzA (DUF378 family)